MEALVLEDRYLVTRIVRALFGYGFGLGARLARRDEPSISASDLLVKVEAVALNPIDHLCVDMVGKGDSILGCDFCGIIVRVGDAVSRRKVGERVAGFVHGGMYPDQGAFATFIKVDADLCWKVPDSMSAQHATTYGLAAATAMQALNMTLQVPWIDSPQRTNTSRPTILIYAAAAATGLFAIQLARSAGYTVVAVCSPRNFDLVKEYGASHTYDYHDHHALAKIKEQHPLVEVAFDAVSIDESTSFCAKVLASSQGRLVTLLDTRKTAKRHGIKAEWIMVFSLFEKPFAWLPPVGPSFEGVPGGREALVRFYSLLSQYTDQIRPLPILEATKGLQNMNANLARLKTEKLSGKKMVALL